MIRYNIILSRPRVDMDVLIPSTFLDPRADIHMIQGLSVHVKSVRVPLLRSDADNLVQLGQARDLRKGRERLHKSELVEVACSYDCCRGINGEDFGNELLSSVSICAWRLWEGASAYACDICLDQSIAHDAVDRRPQVALQARTAAL